MYRFSSQRYQNRVSARRRITRNLPVDDYEKKGLVKKGLMLSCVENSEGLDFCVICQDDIYLDIVRKLSCKHVYHIDCIDKWFIDNTICPTCKRDFS